MAEEWDKRFAVASFNGAWDLIDKTDRSEDDDLEMVLRACASRWHWGRIGGPSELASGDWQVSHVLSLLGVGDLALRFARRNLATAETEGWDGWRLASAHEGMARAYAALADRAARDRHAALATEALARETDADDAKVIASQLATLPEV